MTSSKNTIFDSRMKVLREPIDPSITIDSLPVTDMTDGEANSGSWGADHR
jgi:hypothetical protein